MIMENMNVNKFCSNAVRCINYKLTSFCEFVNLFKNYMFLIYSIAVDFHEENSPEYK